MAGVDGFEESRRRSFTHTWPLAPEYRFVEDHVCPLADGQFALHGSFHAPQGCRTYLPMAHPEIPGELGKAATGRHRDLLEFTSRYGLLGYAEEVLDTRIRGLIGVVPPPPEEKDEPLRGDPLPWMVAHAKTVQLILDLAGRLEDEASLRTYLGARTIRTGQVQVIQYQYARRGYDYLRAHERLSRPGERPRDAALGIIEHLLNEGLEGGVTRNLTVEHQDDGRQGLTSLFKFSNLLDCVYWHLADAVVGGWVRRCANARCGAFFVAKSERIKFCPPPPSNHMNNVYPVSPCLNRNKQQALRDRNRDNKRSETKVEDGQTRSK